MIPSADFTDVALGSEEKVIKREKKFCEKELSREKKLCSVKKLLSKKKVIL